MNGQPRKMKKETHRKPVTSKTFTPLIPFSFSFSFSFYFYFYFYISKVYFTKIIFLFLFQINFYFYIFKIF